MDRAKLLEAVRVEFHKHHFDYYAETVPNSNRKNTVPGCPVCKVRLQTVSQFVDHLSVKVQAAVEREFSRSDDSANAAYRLPVALHGIPLARRIEAKISDVGS
jgi:hypothetical protein